MSHLATTEIETIVRLVIDRLRGGDCACSNGSLQSLAPSPCTCTAQTDSSPQASTANILQLPGKVISFRDIEGRLSGVDRVQILERSIVTPAVRDELSRYLIAIERVSHFQNSSSARIAESSSPSTNISIEIIVSGTKSKLLQTMVADCGLHLVTAGQECRQILQTIVQKWRSQQFWIWYTPQPYAALAAVGEQASGQLRLGQIRAIGLHDLTELESAVQQALPNLLILDEKRWTTHQVVRLIRSWRKLVMST